jgi:hypothetical protein
MSARNCGIHRELPRFAVTADPPWTRFSVHSPRRGRATLTPSRQIDQYVIAITTPEAFACDNPLHSHIGSSMEVCDALDAYLGGRDFVEHLGRLG